MLRARLLGWPSIALALVTVLVVGTAGSRSLAARARMTSPPGAPMPECPRAGEWSTVFTSAAFKTLFKETRAFIGSSGGSGSSFTISGTLALAGPQTDVPEFNDCQQFIDDSGTKPRFISLFAVFARRSLDSVDDKRIMMAGGGFPMAEVLAFDSAYAPLGIRSDDADVTLPFHPGFNCLYFYRRAEGGYDALMVPVGVNEEACARPPESTARGTKLDVDEFHMDKATPNAYPPVAKWDWDPINKLQYIGLRCGNAWCEVHAKSSRPFKSSVHYSLGSGSSGGSAPTAQQHQVVEVKGWYDEQRLAFPLAGSRGRSGSTTSLTVGSFVGTAIPDPDLGNGSGPSKGSRFDGNWIRVASIGISGPPGPYARKLNLTHSAAPTPTNVVYLCYSEPPTLGRGRGGRGPGASTLPANPCLGGVTPTPKCSEPTPSGWWGRIQSDTGKPAYFCVTRREHPGVRIPGIVRWRWAIKDETLWIRCLNGCCEVDAGI